MWGKINIWGLIINIQYGIEGYKFKNLIKRSLIDIYIFLLQDSETDQSFMWDKMKKIKFDLKLKVRTKDKRKRLMKILWKAADCDLPLPC